MCGIFGLINNKKSDAQIKKIADYLFVLSESRGKDASGFAVLTNDNLNIFKKSINAKKFIKEDIYKNIFLSDKKIKAFIGHDRMATNGVGDLENQPFIKGDLVGSHNGIIVNFEKLWEKYHFLQRSTDLDSELLFALLDYKIKKKQNIIQATKELYEELEGYASIAVLFAKFNYLLLASNNGSLYYVSDRDIFVFASEFLILKELTNKIKLNFKKIQHIKSNNAILVKLDDLKIINFSLFGGGDIVHEKEKTNFKIKDLTKYSANNKDGYLKNIIPGSLIHKLEKEYLKRKDKIKKIKRCSKCLLPETMPFISFDKKGVCSYCKNHKKISFLGKEKLKQDILKQAKHNISADYDSMLMFSGGRDSCYALHFLKKELGLNPLAYSYDWGMLTDLGRRNQSRMSAKLGVEHIIISADIRKKRDNIKKNVLAWLKKPNLGIIPLFMAGDKQFFYYANKIKKKLNIDLVFQGSNPYEKTSFKYGFSGVNTKHNFKKNRQISVSNRFSLLSFYTKEFIENPAYLNSSLFDTLFAYFSYYITPRQYFGLFKYIPWDEKEVDRVLIEEYGWETAKDSATTWRIGDGTAAFYNYIYYMVAGFTENDTFRSNQIRDGIISREDGLKKIEQENHPRWQAIKWYCDTIEIDFKKTIEIINNISPLFK